jgi:hypothetical protein
MVQICAPKQNTCCAKSLAGCLAGSKALLLTTGHLSAVTLLLWPFCCDTTAVTLLQ